MVRQSSAAEAMPSHRRAAAGGLNAKRLTPPRDRCFEAMPRKQELNNFDILSNWFATDCWI
ncbi:MAG TPA: hypothetical protein DET40_00950 [Lentisphaeria bacterium]|nr:MAG: hypothetical protein A2X45_25195 [Lentisphaerae bacterium GWF2_50_93]HCE42099.1 hypothetical protein [Lentisphaeria bacterium]